VKFCSQAWSFVLRYEVLYSGMKFCTQAWIFVLRYEVLYSGFKFLHSGMIFCTPVWSFYPCMKILTRYGVFTQVWSFYPGMKILNLYFRDATPRSPDRRQWCGTACRRPRPSPGSSSCEAQREFRAPVDWQTRPPPQPVKNTFNYVHMLKTSLHLFMTEIKFIHDQNQISVRGESSKRNFPPQKVND
jgi:hypothetical protein